MTNADDDILRRLNPVLNPFRDARTDLSTDRIAAARVSVNGRRRESAATLDTRGVDIVDAVARADGSRRDIPVRIYRGGSSPAPAPVVLYCHAGAFVLGNLDIDQLQCTEMARRAQCTVVSVDYRLAPEHPHPAGFEDTLAAMKWVAAEAQNLGVDPDRLVVAGNSAGGALAAGLAHCAADGIAPAIVFQMLHQPVLDDRPTPSKDEFATTPGFDGPAAKQMWRHLAGGQTMPTGAVPARREDLTGLAPALVTCSELDPLRDEAIDYARRLMSAGVAAELHVYPGTCHGFDSLLPDWDVSQHLFALQGAALRRVFDDARQRYS